MPYDAKKVAGQQLKIKSDLPGFGGVLKQSAIAILFRDIDGKFATTIGGAIIKKSNGEILPDDEPLFLFRARDNKAIRVLNFYRELCELDSELEWQAGKMGEIVDQFIDFATEHPDRMKKPGITKGL